MKETLVARQVRDALAKCAVIAPRRAVPSAGRVEVRVGTERVTFSSTDLEDFVVSTVERKGAEECRFVVPCKPWLRFMGKGDDGALGFEVSNNSVLFSRSTIGNLNLTRITGEFPSLPKFDVRWHKLPGDFFRVLKVILLGCSSDYARPVLTCVCFSEGKMASADGFRLYAYKNKALEFGLAEADALVYRDFLVRAARLFGQASDVEVGFDTVNHVVAFRAGETTLIGKLASGMYPRYDILIPKDFTCRVTFSVPLMLERIGLIPDDAFGCLRFKFDLSQQACELSSAREDEFMDCNITVPVAVKQEDGKIALNPKYAVEAMRGFSVCEMGVTMPSQPVLLTGDVEGLSVVIMPMFVQW